MAYDLFVSYSRKDNERSQVTDLITQIKADYCQFAAEELQCFFDITEIHTMDDWRHRILGGLRESNLLLLVLSPAYLASPYCEWEIVEFLKYEHSKAVQGQGVASVYFVEIPGLESPEFQQQAAAWLARVRQRNHVDLRPWYDEGKTALSRDDVRMRLEDLEHSLVDRLTRLRRIESAPGNLPAHNPHFVGREVEMERLHRAAGFGQFGVLTAVQGVGGLGKTALAIQYAYAYADFFPGGRWQVGCAGKVSLAGAIRSLDVDLKIQLSDDEKADDIRAAKRVLAVLKERAEQGAAERSGERQPPSAWTLLILDNVDDPAMLQPPQADIISGLAWLHIVATTRLDPALIGADQSRYCHLPVDELPEDDAQRLIEGYQPNGQFASESERAASLEIVKLLGGFTLAVEVVAVHLGERAGQLSCAALFERLRREGVDPVAKGTRGPVNHTERLMSATLAPTLETLSDSEMATLGSASLCPPDSIALPWIRHVVAEAHPEVAQDAELGYDDPWLMVVNHLIGLRLLQVVEWAEDNQTPRVCRMHRLVQSVTKAQAGIALSVIEASLTQVVIERANVLAKEWFQPANRWEIQPLAQHAQQCVEFEKDNAAWLAHQAAYCISKLGDYATAEPLYQRSLAIKEQALGPNHPDVATGLNNLASLYRDLGQFAKAEPLFKRSLAIWEKVNGPDHLDVATGLNNLALLYYTQGQYAEAQPLYIRSLEILEKILYSDHLDMATSLNNLALLYCVQGQYAKAQPLYLRSLAISESELGSEHPQVASCLNNLAEMHRSQGKYVEAEPLYRRSLSIRENAFGPNHPDVATSLNNLASLYHEQKRYADAEPLFYRSLATSENILGTDHPDVAINLNNLAALYGAQTKYAKAQLFYQRALAILEKSLGANHPNVAVSLNNLAELYCHQRQYAKAEPLIMRSLAIREKALGPDHPDVALSLNNLALLYDAQGQYAKAEPLFWRSLVIHERAFGPDHPSVATSLNNLASLFHDQGQYIKAESLYRRSLAISEKVLGPNDPEVATSLNNLADLYHDLGQFAQAEPLYKRSLTIREKVLGPDHSHVAASLNNLAGLYRDQGQYSKAEPLYQRSLAIKEQALGPGHPSVATSLNNLAALYRNTGRDREAETLEKRAIAIRDKSR